MLFHFHLSEINKKLKFIVQCFDTYAMLTLVMQVIFRFSIILVLKDILGFVVKKIAKKTLLLIIIKKRKMRRELMST